MSQKTRIFIYILIAAAAVIMGILGIMQRNSGGNAVTAQEKLDLGRNYLIELSYSKAVIEFTDAIEIEPLNADAYLGLAEAYEGLGDTEKAIETLETGYELTGDERLREMLDRLSGGLSTEVETTTAAETAEDAETAEASEYCENVTMYVPYDVDYYSTSEYSTVDSYYTGFDSFFLNNRNFEATFSKYSSQPQGEGDIPDTANCSFYSHKINEDILYSNNEPIFNIICYNSDYSFHSSDDESNLNTYPRIGYYDQDGNIVKQCKSKYDNNGNLIESNLYDSEGNLQYSTKYEYDESGKIIRSVYNGGVSKYNYDANGNLLSKISYDSDGKETDRQDMTYDADNNRTGDSTDYYRYNWEYDHNGNMVKEIYEYYSDYNGFTSESSYDASGNLIKYHYQSDAFGMDQTSAYEYDANGNRIRETRNVRNEYDSDWTESEDVIQYSYDSKGRIIKEIYNSNHTFNHYSSYDENGNGIGDISASTSISEIITEYSYNSYDQIVNETQSYNSISHHDYGDSEYDSISYCSYEYDSEGRLINKTENQSGNYGDSSSVTKYTYGDGDRLIKQEKYIDGELYESVELKYVKIEFPKIFAEQIYEKYGIDLTK